MDDSQPVSVLGRFIFEILYLVKGKEFLDLSRKCHLFMNYFPKISSETKERRTLRELCGKSLKELHPKSPSFCKTIFSASLTNLTYPNLI